MSWACSRVRIKASASGRVSTRKKAEDPGFKSQRARFKYSPRKIEDSLNVLNESHLSQTDKLASIVVKFYPNFDSTCLPKSVISTPLKS